MRVRIGVTGPGDRSPEVYCLRCRRGISEGSNATGRLTAIGEARGMSVRIRVTGKRGHPVWSARSEE